MSSRIRITFPENEKPANILSDLNWVSDNRSALYKKYGSCYVLVYKEEIIGMGKTIDEAIQDAESRLSPNVEFVTPAIGNIFNPNESYFYIKELMRQHFAQKRQKGDLE